MSQYGVLGEMSTNNITQSLNKTQPNSKPMQREFCFVAAPSRACVGVTKRAFGKGNVFTFPGI